MKFITSIVKFLKNVFTKSNWETVFSGDVKSRSGGGRLMLQVERKKNLYRAIAYSGAWGEHLEISLGQLVHTFPEAMTVLRRENIRW
jgi:hypothetical protein